MPVSEQTYLQLVREDPDSNWELHCGQLRCKPSMTAEHGDLPGELGFQLRQQLDRSAFRLRYNHGRVRRSNSRYYVPDLIVIPAAIEQAQRGQPDTPELYVAPLPLVVEVWSPSTGGVDVSEKLPEYQRRGDLEIWFLHPYQKTLTSWMRQPDGSYHEAVYHDGMIHPAAFPYVTIDLDALFEDL